MDLAFRLLLHQFQTVFDQIKTSIYLLIYRVKNKLNSSLPIGQVAQTQYFTFPGQVLGCSFNVADGLPDPLPIGQV